MTKEKTTAKKNRRGFKNIIPIASILIVIIGIPLLLLNYQAKRSGLTRGDVKTPEVLMKMSPE
jgi:hypothetical protein